MIGRGTGKLTRTVLPQANAYAMIGRRAAAAGIETKLGNRSFRATGITAYLKSGGTLEKAAAMANHASTRTTQLCDRRREELTLDEVERIGICAVSGGLSGFFRFSIIGGTWRHLGRRKSVIDDVEEAYICFNH
jgi:hypothetical protein